jgi:uncharacterized protein
MKVKFVLHFQNMIHLTTINWKEIESSLSQNGYATLENLIPEATCHAISSLYAEEGLYRNTISMERYRFGKGEYKYFQYPLPDVIQSLRQELYSRLSIVANKWMDLLDLNLTFPKDHPEFINRCHLAHQTRPTPLILRYEQGGFNTLHQDLYGEVYFPFQVVVVLNESGKDYTGGEFVMVEQLPRAQSKVKVLQLKMGDALIFTTNFRPVKGTKGYFRARMKHGISELTGGVRYAMGIIFHDAA